MPTACAAIPIRPPSSVAIAMWKPLPSSCNSRSASTSASTAIEFVVEELSPSFSSRRGDADVAGVEDEGRDAAGSGRVRIGAREEEERPRVFGGRDELLRARDSPPVALPCRRRPERPGIRTCLRLGQREGADQLAAGERRDETRALLVGAEAEQRQRHGARVDGDRDPNAGVGARELLEHEHVGEKVGARRRRTPRARRRPSARARPASRRPRAGSGARDPTRPRAARPRRGRSHA